MIKSTLVYSLVSIGFIDDTDLHTSWIKLTSSRHKKGSSCIVVGEEPFRQIKSLIEIGPGRFGKGISIAEQNSNT